MAEVSVITPFLNAEAYLEQAIASVQAQTFGDWELLLVDDGSSDASPQMAAAAAAADPRIRVVAPDPARRGAAAARNRGMDAARGRFIAFLDADDLFEPTKLAFELAMLERAPQAAWVYGPTLWWWEGENPRTWTETMRRFAGRTHPAPALFNAVLLGQQGDVPCTCAVMIRRSAIEEVGGFEEQFALYEDQSLWAKLLLRYPVYVADKFQSRYRQHPDSTSNKATEGGDYDRYRPHAARIEFLRWAAEHARTHGLMTPQTERAFRLAFAPYDLPEWPLGPGDHIALATRRASEAAVRARRTVRRSLRGMVGR
ncbi:MAG: hypothetical protein C0481_01755 [Phenylobacterium sp.]|uniref:glycosyltransferase family 2 protein n=1 Tax=Phenylobacterium sp. TaxID=1871053 RepID=UPI0025D7AC0A|nr:glycosyltransferase [Phenylobacterium sp.]MBA4010568.1 hypothetical protein [Phenylobacterium sp.]